MLVMPGYTLIHEPLMHFFAGLYFLNRRTLATHTDQNLRTDQARPVSDRE